MVPYDIRLGYIHLGLKKKQRRFPGGSPGVSHRACGAATPGGSKTWGLKWEVFSPTFLNSSWFFSKHIWVFPKIREPLKWLVYNGKPYQNGWFGGTTIFGNIHIGLWNNPHNWVALYNHTQPTKVFLKKWLSWWFFSNQFQQHATVKKWIISNQGVKNKKCFLKPSDLVLGHVLILRCQTLICDCLVLGQK